MSVVMKYKGFKPRNIWEYPLRKYYYRFDLLKQCFSIHYWPLLGILL